MAGDIYLDTTSTTAGIKPLFWFIPVRDVASQDGATITLKSGKQWHTAKGSKFKSSVETANLSARLYRVGFSATVAHISPALEKVINSYTIAEGYLVIYEDLNGYRWLLGSLEQPLKLRHRYQSGNRPGSSTGVRLTFSGSQLGAPRLEYTDSIDASTPVPPPAGAQVSIINSDGSYSATSECGSSFVLPDINVIKRDGSKITWPAVKDIDILSLDPCRNPASWDEMVAAYGHGYHYTNPTGYPTSMRAWDDKYVEDNVLAAARDGQELRVKNQLQAGSVTRFKNANVFGNTFRFTSDIGGYYDGGYYYDKNGVLSDKATQFANAYIIDHYTGYGWADCRRIYDVVYPEFSGGLDWYDMIDYGANKSLFGFDDWFICNIPQLNSILTFGANDMGIEVFEQVFDDWSAYSIKKFITSTTAPNNSANSVFCRIETGYDWFAQEKMSVMNHPQYRSILCRKHF